MWTIKIIDRITKAQLRRQVLEHADRETTELTALAILDMHGGIAKVEAYFWAGGQGKFYEARARRRGKGIVWKRTPA